MPNALSTVDKLLHFDTAKAVGSHLLKHPYRYPLAVGGVLAATDALGPKATELESEIMRNRVGTPGGKYVFAELDNVERRKSFMEDATAFRKHAGWGDAIQAGVGSGIGRIGSDMLRGLISSAVSGLSNVISNNPKRRTLLAQIVAHDPIVSMYESQHPGSAEKAYSSMVNVAPTISLDPNVVTSFLREAAQTGGSINYMTLKQLAEAENAVRTSTSMDTGGHR